MSEQKIKPSLEKALRLVARLERDPSITKGNVMRRVCFGGSVTPAQLLGGRNLEYISALRQGLYYLYRTMGCSYREIASLTKRDDHTTIMHGVRKIQSHLVKHD